VTAPRRAGPTGRPVAGTLADARAQRLLRAALTTALVVVLYGNTLGNDFVWDDRLLARSPPPLGDVLGARTGPYYRPLVMLTFHADRALFGDRPAGYHATNLLAHAATSVLTGELAVAVGLGPGAALAAALAFAAHPAQTDAVSYVSGRTDVLCALFLLLAVLLWRRAARATDGHAVAAAVAFTMALLSKEAAAPLATALLVPGAHPATRPPRPYLPLAVAVAWALLYFGTAAAPPAAGSLAERAPGVLMVAASYVRLLVVPTDLHLERFVAADGWSAPALAAGAAVVAASLAALVLAARHVAGGAFLLAFAVLAYLPGAGLVPVYPAIADRWLFAPEHFLYVPLIGLAPLAAGAAAALPPAVPRRFVATAAAALVLWWSVLTIDRNRAWRDEATLFRDALRYAPPTARLWFNAGNLALSAGRLDEAGALYEQAIARAPRDPALHLNLGIVRQRQGRVADAIRQYEVVLALDPRHDGAARALAALRARRP
jgi:hypothetical protein